MRDEVTGRRGDDGAESSPPPSGGSSIRVWSAVDSMRGCGGRVDE